MTTMRAMAVAALDEEEEEARDDVAAASFLLILHFNPRAYFYDEYAKLHTDAAAKVFLKDVAMTDVAGLYKAVGFRTMYNHQRCHQQSD